MHKTIRTESGESFDVELLPLLDVDQEWFNLVLQFSVLLMHRAGWYLPFWDALELLEERFPDLSEKETLWRMEEATRDPRCQIDTVYVAGRGFCLAPRFAQPHRDAGSLALLLSDSIPLAHEYVVEKRH